MKTLEQLKEKRLQFARANPKHTDLIREFISDINKQLQEAPKVEEDVVEKIKEQYTKDIKLLRELYKQELDAISLKSLDEFLIRANNRPRHLTPADTSDSE